MSTRPSTSRARSRSCVSEGGIEPLRDAPLTCRKTPSGHLHARTMSRSMPFSATAFRSGSHSGTGAASPPDGGVSLFPPGGDTTIVPPDWAPVQWCDPGRATCGPGSDQRPGSHLLAARRGRSKLTMTILIEGQVRDLVKKMLKTAGRTVDLSTPRIAEPTCASRRSTPPSDRGRQSGWPTLGVGNAPYVHRSDGPGERNLGVKPVRPRVPLASLLGSCWVRVWRLPSRLEDGDGGKQARCARVVTDSKAWRLPSPSISSSAAALALPDPAK